MRPNLKDVLGTDRRSGGADPSGPDTTGSIDGPSSGGSNGIRALAERVRRIGLRTEADSVEIVRTMRDERNSR